MFSIIGSRKKKTSSSLGPELPVSVLQKIKMIQNRTKYSCNVVHRAKACTEYGTVDLNIFPGLPMATYLVKQAAKEVGINFEQGKCCKVCKSHAKLIFKELLNSCKYKIQTAYLKFVVNSFMKALFGSDIVSMANFLNKLDRDID